MEATTTVNPRTSQEPGRGAEAELSATARNREHGLKTRGKTISALACAQGRRCGLFKAMSLNRDYHGPDSVDEIPRMLGRSEVSSLPLFRRTSKVMQSNTCSDRKWLENLGVNTCKYLHVVLSRELSKNRSFMSTKPSSHS